MLWGAGSDGEPHDLFYGHTDALGEGSDLTLEIIEKGVGAPSADDLDGAVRLVSLAKCNGTALEERVIANLVRVKP